MTNHVPTLLSSHISVFGLCKHEIKGIPGKKQEKHDIADACKTKLYDAVDWLI